MVQPVFTSHSSVKGSGRYHCKIIAKGFLTTA